MVAIKTLKALSMVLVFRHQFIDTKTDTDVDIVFVVTDLKCPLSEK
jgi:hypothetical protein